jgi:hypothetical protein
MRNSGQLAAVGVAWWSSSGTGGHCVCGGVAAVNARRSGWAAALGMERRPLAPPPIKSESPLGNAEAMVRVTRRRGMWSCGSACASFSGSSRIRAEASIGRHAWIGQEQGGLCAASTLHEPDSI